MATGKENIEIPTNRVSREAVFGSLKDAVARKNLSTVRAIAAKYGFKKHLGGTVPTYKARAFAKEVEDKELFKPHIGISHRSTRGGVLPKNIVNALVEQKPVVADASKTIAEEREQQLEEKNKIKQAAGLKVNATQGPTSKAELHKINMARALDMSGVESIDAAIQGDANAPAAARNEHRTVSKIALAPEINVPRQAAPQKSVVAVDPFGED